MHYLSRLAALARVLAEIANGERFGTTGELVAHLQGHWHGGTRLEESHSE
jgi:hypothetical protein